MNLLLNRRRDDDFVVAGQCHRVTTHTLSAWTIHVVKTGLHLRDIGGRGCRSQFHIREHFKAEVATVHPVVGQTQHDHEHDRVYSRGNQRGLTGHPDATGTRGQSQEHAWGEQKEQECLEPHHRILTCDGILFRLPTEHIVSVVFELVQGRGSVFDAAIVPATTCAVRTETAAGFGAGTLCIGRARSHRAKSRIGERLFHLERVVRNERNQDNSKDEVHRVRAPGHSNIEYDLNHYLVGT